MRIKACSNKYLEDWIVRTIQTRGFFDTPGKFVSLQSMTRLMLFKILQNIEREE